MQPGETITPGTVTPPTPQTDTPQPPQPVLEVSQPPAEAPAPETPAEPTPQPAATWQFTANDDPQQTPAAPSAATEVSWTASEYIAHNKGTAWFAMLGAVLFVLVGVVYLVTKDLVAPIGVALAGLTFGIFAARTPRVLEYAISPQGIKMGQRFYPYADFKSFAIVDEGPLPAILLLPLKRFLPPITVFYDQKEEDTILETLGNYLPHQEQQPDVVDRLMRRIRF